MIPGLYCQKTSMDQLLYNLFENKNAWFLTHTVNQIENVKIIVLAAISRYSCYEVEQIFFLFASFEWHFVFISEYFGMSLKC